MVAPGRDPGSGRIPTSRPRSKVLQMEARALWHRAAELQAEAARRLEERSRQLAPRGHPSDTAEVEGYRLADVRAAAEEAGISSEFVDHALVEAHNRTLVEGAQARPSAMAARFLGQPPLTLEVSRVIHAPAEEVYGAMQRTAFQPPAPGHRSACDRVDRSREPDPQPQAQYVGRGRLLGVGRVVERCRWRLCGRERGRRPRDRGYRSRRGGIGLPCWWSSGRRGWRRWAGAGCIVTRCAAGRRRSGT